ncbi:MAG: hypothetical protein HQL69_08350 [Magnetococcales bacterium]|nr:hypothetical protein [Magnetococcales bacterium]
MSTTSAKRKLPVEVQLAWEVMTCRAMRSTYEESDHPCQWFNDYFGPYPGFSWVDSVPPDSYGEEEGEYMAQCTGQRFQIPELVTGCRKAPIMTIGINPNQTAYFPSVDGSTWCYPYMDNVEDYAYYFRHRSLTQEHFTLEFIRSNVIPATKIIAEADGEFVGNISRSSNTGGIDFNLEYYQDGDSKADYKTSFHLKDGYLVFYDQYNDKKEYGKFFKKGDIIAGCIELTPGSETTVIRKKISYYSNFDKIFQLFVEKADLADNELQLAEDVCQADMVACSSPGWDGYFTDSVLEGITHECLNKRGWIDKQILQARPKLVILAGDSSYDMFANLYAKNIVTDLDLSSDLFEMLVKTQTDKIFFKIPLNHDADLDKPEDYQLCRLVISPHFSYGDNFRPQVRISDDDWRVLISGEYADICEELVENKQVAEAFGDVWVVYLDGRSVGGGKKCLTQDEWKDSKYDCFRSYPIYDVNDLISEIILQEYKDNNLVMKGKHFQRTDGSCQFCVNDLYAFSEGCLYGKVNNKDTITKTGSVS